MAQPTAPTPRRKTTTSSPERVDLVDSVRLARGNLQQVFDGSGVEGKRLLDPDQLAAIGPEQLLDARLVGVSCLRLFSLRYPVHRYFTAVRRKQKPVPSHPAETYLAVTRQRYVVRQYELSFPAYQILQALLAGESVGRPQEPLGSSVAQGVWFAAPRWLSPWPTV